MSTVLRGLQILLVLLMVGAAGGLLWAGMHYLHWGSALAPATADYAGEATTDCPATPRPAPGGRLGAIRYRVRAPVNYRAAQAHPLVVVYASAGLGPGLVERYTGLTRALTARGYLVAYVGSIRLSEAAVTALAQIPTAIAAQWCVDRQRIVLTGHSDGGTVAQIIAASAGNAATPAAIAASAAGVRADDLAAYACPTPRDVAILHGRNDEHFPGYGRQALGWWQDCLDCDPTGQPAAAGCTRFGNCQGDALLWWCPHEGGHLTWKGNASRLLAFLEARQPPPLEAPQ